MTCEPCDVARAKTRLILVVVEGAMTQKGVYLEYAR